MPQSKKAKERNRSWDQFRRGLKRMFANDAIVRKVSDVKLKTLDTDGRKFQQIINQHKDKYIKLRQRQGIDARSAAAGFQQQRNMLFQDYECLAGETEIPLSNGELIRIDELAKKYPNKNNKFYVYSYDHDNNCVAFGEAHSVRKTKTELTYKIIFDNKEYLLATANHPFLMRNGEYKRVDELVINDSVMPFCQNKYISATLNRKIISIEPYKIQDVYDMTVEKYHNFSTKSCFVHNSMDQDPILSSALDIYADECLAGETIVPLLSGEKLSIKELYNKNKRNFWVYGIDEKHKNFVPVKCEKVNYNGKKQMYEIILDDGTTIKATDKHIWVKSDGTLIKTADLQVGENLKVLATKVSGGKLSGYEMIKNNGKFEFTHRIVARNNKELAKLSNKRLMKKYNMLSQTLLYKLNKKVRDKLNINNICCSHHLNIEEKFNKLNINIAIVREVINNFLMQNINPKRNMSKIAKNLNITCGELYYLIRKHGYNTFNEFVDADNHQVVSIKKVEIEDAYDLVNVGNVHIYALETNDGGKLYTHNSTTLDEYGNLLVINSEDEEIKAILENLFYDILNIDFNLWSWIRNMCKYGDMFLQIDVHDTIGIINVMPLSVYDVQRIEGEDILHPKDYYFTLMGDTKNKLENFEVAHFRMYTDANFLPYGKCLTGDTRIDTRFGNKYLEELKIGEEVWTYNVTLNKFELVSIKNKINSGEKEIIKISTQHNFIKSSQSHPILTFDIKAKKMKYKLAKNIKLGDLLVVSTGSYHQIKTLKTGSALECDDSNNIISLDPVIKIENIGMHQTWDIQVDSLNSNFIGNGIIVHNSMIEAARKPWKQLSLMEDAMLIHRIMRSPEKRIYKIDIGNMAPEDVDQYMTEVIDKMKKVPYVNPRTGEYNLKFNMQNMLEDIFLPVRGGDTGTEIDTLSGMEFDTIDDIDYIKNRMMAALKIPKPFLGYAEEVEGKCISLDTKIPLWNDKVKTVQEIINDFKQNKIKNYVCSIDKNQNIIPGEIEWAGKTRLNTQVVKVILDNTKSIICTPDHKFMLKDGSYVEAQNLIKNQLLMPCYVESLKNKYNIIEVRVKEVIWLKEKVDTADLTIKNHHNFATEAGVFIHNSTLAAMDLRFARTIERIQKIVVSELYKLAAIHLYAQGFTEKDLVNFDLELTSPSIVYEEEKIAIWDSRADLVTSLKETSMVSENYIYEKILNMSKGDITKMRREIIEDKKREHRYESIVNDGDDPYKSGYEVKDNANSDEENQSDDYSYENANSDGSKSNKKKKKKKTIGDILFNDDDKVEHPKLDKSSHKHRYKGGSPLSLEDFREYLNNKKQKKDKEIL